MDLFEVIAKCGHVGRNHFVLKTFAVRAENGKEAANIVRQIPRVKHHHKDAIQSVRLINQERYDEIIKANNLDKYFCCKNIQQQRMIGLFDIYDEEDQIYDKHEEIRKPVYVGKKLLRNPRKYCRNYNYEETRYAG